MNNYELTIILDGKSTPAKKDSFGKKLEKLVIALKGKIKKVSDWGVKEFSYKIGKSDTGVYIFFELELDGNGAKNLSTKLKMEPDIIRYLLIRKDKEK